MEGITLPCIFFVHTHYSLGQSTYSIHRIHSSWSPYLLQSNPPLLTALIPTPRKIQDLSRRTDPLFISRCPSQNLLQLNKLHNLSPQRLSITLPPLLKFLLHGPHFKRNPSLHHNMILGPSLRSLPPRIHIPPSRDPKAPQPPSPFFLPAGMGLVFPTETVVPDGADAGPECGEEGNYTVRDASDRSRWIVLGGPPALDLAGEMLPCCFKAFQLSRVMFREMGSQVIIVVRDLKCQNNQDADGAVRRNISVGLQGFRGGNGRVRERRHDQDNIRTAKAVKSDLGISERY
jgi:hypothetical protein